MSKFQPLQFYNNKASSKYHLLPFRFSPLDDQRVVATNMVGEHLVVSRPILRQLVEHKLPSDSKEYKDFRAKHFVLDEMNEVAMDLLALKFRTKIKRLSDFTSLHIFVVSLRCEHSCPYCQVSRQSEDRDAFDMSNEVAEKSLDLVFKSPSENIKIEFQGGEPLLNFDRIKQVVRSANERNKEYKKNLDFVIATNLALVNKEILEYCREHSIHISTSLDGPADLHNKNRPRPGRDSYERVIEGINLVRDVLGKDQVSALMTTTEASLPRVRDIIDEYLKHDFAGIFLRFLSPYGFAIKTKSYRAYTTERWLDFYKEGLAYIIELNKKGIFFQEYYASTVLKKMLTSEDSGFVDLMNPAGIGIAAVVYNYDGSVHPSDESRMLAEMGDNTFLLGNVLTHSYEDIFSSAALLEPLQDSFTASVPMCNECAFEPYCGSDPVYHYAIHKDFVGKKPESDFCKRNMEIFRYLISLMEEDNFVRQMFFRWANGR